MSATRDLQRRISRGAQARDCVRQCRVSHGGNSDLAEEVKEKIRAGFCAQLRQTWQGIRDALSELLTRFPEADLLRLEAEQRDFAIEQFTAADVFHRFELDVGKTIVEKALSAVIALARLKEVRAGFDDVRSVAIALAAAATDGFDTWLGHALGSKHDRQPKCA